jgi:hypothetical protein
MQKIGVNIVIVIMPVANASILCKIAGTTVSTHHAIESNITAIKITSVIIVEMTIEMIIAVIKKAITQIVVVATVVTTK